MAAHLPDGMPSILPYLHYDDVAAAIEWLSKAFGLSVRVSMPGSDGSIVHAEMSLGSGFVMMGPANQAQGTASPRSLPSVNQSLYVYVDDVDAHFRHARASGARITSEPVDMFWGDRMYAARDCEGHHWTFAQHLRDTPANP
jgi:uncharacterized glyoxalase superfamily protein PhnB